MSYQFYDIIMASLQWCHKSFSKITSYHLHHFPQLCLINFVKFPQYFQFPARTSHQLHQSPYFLHLNLHKDFLPTPMTSMTSSPSVKSYRTRRLQPCKTQRNEIFNHKYLTVNSRWQNQLIIRFTALSDEKMILKYPAKYKKMFLHNLLKILL